MDEREQQRLKELADRRRPALEIREEMAGLQDKKYRESQKSLATSKEQVQCLLSQWSEAADQHLVGEPIPVDLHKYSGLDQSGYGENSTNRFIDGVHQQIIQAVDDRDTYKYLWVTQRQDGMVVTVGQTSFKKVLHKGKESTSNSDDLFKQLKRPSGAASMVVWHYPSDQTDAEINEYLRTYLKWAWIIPVNLDKATDGATDRQKISRLETKLGDYLIRKNVPILNFYSHRA
ncbi:hypothetical protein ACN50C_12405 [Levilactobacillus brevis]|uniref:hypothetical protein n=1 Tax=Levilactobacillus brevis TaxID=1580 RepID=UPI001EF6B505|nr:hypothetical protein [Levilactobacillus brevis]ULH73335.1 hypothetical protein MD222_06035 [Levilactobacillus brevis]WAE44039.1 hypothetical protein OUY26_06665 [Levilactobacillus brevis]